MHSELQRHAPAGAAAAEPGPRRHAPGRPTPPTAAAARGSAAADPLAGDDPFDTPDDVLPEAAAGVWTKVLGRTREQRRVRLLLTLFAVLMIAIAVVMSSYFRDGQRMNRLSLDTGLAMVGVQKLERSLERVIEGNGPSDGSIGRLQTSLAATFESLAASVGPSVGEDPLPALVAGLNADWEQAVKALGALGASRGDVFQIRTQLRERLEPALGELVDAADELVLASAAARSRNDLTEAARIALSATRLQQALSPVRYPDGFDDKTTGAALGEIDAIRQRLARMTGDGVIQARALRRVDDALGAASLAAQAYTASDPRIVQAASAAARTRQAVTALESRLIDIRTAMPAADERRAVLTRIAAALALAAAICALALSRAYVWLGNTRAEQAEQQRAQAERLQAEARRTNDQNQAAILRLMNELQEVADGDLTVQATVSEDITGAIADSVNYTIEELRSLVARINSTAELVNDASSKAQLTSARLLAASAQQSREIRETGEAVLGLATQIDDVSLQAAESVQVARQSLQASQEGARAVDHAIAGMNMIRDQIQETAKRIKRLGESSQEIGEIVEMISGLSEQTNVLALNAAIQAASAGEAGRGFSFVAEEVQRLAERSAEATKQIAVLIQTIQADTQDAVAAMERCTQGVVDGTQRSDEAGSALGQIGRVSNQIAQLIEGFSATTSQQAASAATVAESIQRMLQVTEQTSQGTAETAGSVQKLSELALELKNSVSRFKVT